MVCLTLPKKCVWGGGGWAKPPIAPCSDAYVYPFRIHQAPPISHMNNKFVEC